MVLVTQSFGNENEYRRAIFAVWSCWAHYKIEMPVILFTDRDAFFKPFFEGQKVHFVNLTAEKINEMRGKIDFLHRMKIAIIQEAFELTQSDLIYIDSDTFFISNPSIQFNQTQGGVCFMHLPEYAFAEMRSMPLPAAKVAHAFLNLIENNQFTLANGQSVQLDINLYSWNAGVMFLPGFVKTYLPDVFGLTDQFFPQTNHHASEQFAFSFVLQMNSKVTACDTVIYHYWYRVKKVVMDNWLNKFITTGWAVTSQEEKIKFIKKWNSILPHYLENHVLSLRDGAIQAFHENKFKEGYKLAFKALLKQPFEKKFILDLLYHTKRFKK